MENKKPDRCPACGLHDIARKAHEKFFNTLWRCNACRMIFVWPQPTKEELEALYGAEYFHHHASQLYGYDDYFRDKRNIMHTAHKRLKNIERWYPQKGKLLDVGCAMGFFVETALERGWDAYGIDISRDAIEVARQKLGERVESGMLAESAYFDEQFDVITMWDVIEHVPDPRAEIAKAASLLKRGGLLVVATPDAGSLVAKIAGNKWMGFKDLEHLFYFTRVALEKLFEDNGFAVRKMHYTGKHITFDLFTRRLSLYSGLFSALCAALEKIYGLSERSIYINPFDIVTVYADKK